MLPTVASIELNAMALAAAEQLGVDDVWFCDHLLGFTHPELWKEWPAAQALPDPDAFLDPFCAAAALGGRTQLTMGVNVTDATRRRGVDHVRAALTCHDACNGGFILGIGAGEAESIRPFGYEWDKPVGMLEKALIEIRSLFETGEMPGDLPGRSGLPMISAKGICEVWVASQRPRALKLTGRYGDGWMPPPISPQEYALGYDIVKQAADDADRSMPTASLLPVTLFGQSREQVCQLLDEIPVIKLLCMFLPDAVWQKHGLTHPCGPGTRGHLDVVYHVFDPDELRALAPRIPIELVEEFLMIGNAEEIAARLKPYTEIGLEHVVLGDVTGTTYAPQDAVTALGELAKLKALLDTI
jgi:phthiodiolone/phenolphthiodiolone dimycocerosates ketoreductase